MSEALIPKSSETRFGEHLADVIEQHRANDKGSQRVAARVPSSIGDSRRLSEYIPLSVREAGGLTLDFWKRGWLDDQAARELAEVEARAARAEVTDEMIERVAAWLNEFVFDVEQGGLDKRNVKDDARHVLSAAFSTTRVEGDASDA